MNLNISKLVSQLSKTALIMDDYENMRTVIASLRRVHGVNANYDPAGSTNTRVLLHCNRNNRHQVATECNGIIMDYADDWKVVCRPTPLAHNSIPDKTDLARYDVYASQDGTVVNLYYYKDAWRIGTARGIDMNSAQWSGITYADAMFRDCKLDTSGLDKSATWTFGFSHPSMHPLQKHSLWFIACNGDTGAKPPAGFERQATVECKTIRDVSAVLKDPKSYGLVLRPRAAGLPHYILESETMREIRELLYDRKLTRDSMDLRLPRMKYIVTRAALNSDIAERMVRTFPFMSDEIKRIQTLVRDTAQKILSHDISAQPWIDEISKIMDPSTLEKMYTQEQLVQFLSLEEYVPLWCVEVFASA